jgi:hypothetical protein
LRSGSTLAFRDGFLWAFRVFYQMSGGVADKEHPPSTFRMLIAVQSVISQMLPDFEMIAELSGQIVFEAEMLLAPIISGQPAPATSAEELANAGQLFEPLNEHLKALWPTFEPYAVVKNRLSRAVKAPKFRANSFAAGGRSYSPAGPVAS